ncbi:MAG: hypothetical protein H0T75_12850 [Rhizobiales bacterium]|nr:hypothetical protein [Hyphomicrobiales bacterium]
MEDQAVHVVGDVGERQFCLGAGKADGADKEAETGLLVGEVEVLAAGAAAITALRCR